PPAPRAVNPEVSEAWSRATMRALAKRPEARFQTAAELGDELAQVLETLRRGPEPRRPTPPPAGAPAASAAPTPLTSPTPVQTPPNVGGHLTGKVLEPPRPLDARHQASFRAHVVSRNVGELGTFTCSDISKGGLFLVSDGQLP